MPQRSLLLEDDEETRRCRRVRDEMNRRFKTVDALCDHLERLEKAAPTKRVVRSATARAHRLAHPPARNGKPAQRKPVHRL